MNDILVSVDIGLGGGIAFFDTVSEFEPIYLKSMPTLEVEKNGKKKRVIDIDRLKFILETPKQVKDSVTLVMEDVHAFPGQGVVAVGTLLEQKGIILGMAKAFEYEVVLVSPKTWQKHFDIIPPKDIKGKSASQTKTLRKKWIKEKSLELARARFSKWEEKLRPSTAHGLSDSLLMGQWIIETTKT